MNTSLRGLLRGVAVVLTAAAPPPVLCAQTTPTVFVHGILSSGETWNAMVSTLTSGAEPLAIRPKLPSLLWLRTEVEQAGALYAHLNEDGGTIGSNVRLPFVAHSNGGVASRTLSNMLFDHRINKLVTVATPHRGSRLANNVVDGVVVNYAAWFWNSLQDPVDLYHNYYIDNQLDEPLALSLASEAMGGIQWVVGNLNYYLCDVLPICDQFLNLAPLAYDLRVGGPFMNVLNSPANGEANRIVQRFGIWTMIPPNNALFRLLFTNPNPWIQVKDGVALLYRAAEDGAAPRFLDSVDRPFLWSS